MLFSVIVPIYRVEKYLKRCIDSVLCQSCKDFELILVDDGSPDNCPEICDKYAAENANIKVIHKENGGLVSARQAGIKIASGEYVLNLDGDDAFLPGAIENAKRAIEKTGADIICFSHKEYCRGEEKAVEKCIVPEGFYDKENMKKYVYPHILTDANMKHIPCYLWGKAVKRSLITAHQLNVSQNISQGEDLSCIIPCILEANSFYVDSAPIYLYTMRDDSLSTSFNTKQITHIAETINGFYSITLPKPEDFEKQISRYSAYMCLAIVAAAAEGGHFKYINEIKNLILNSVHKNLIKKSEFENITFKSKVAINLMKKEHIKTAFYFLNFCGRIKSLIKRG